MAKYTAEKFDLMIREMVAEFGEGAEVKLKHMKEFWTKNRERYPHIIAIQNDNRYKTEKYGVYKITTKYLDEVNTQQKNKTQLPEDVRKDPIKLLKEIVNHADDTGNGVFDPLVTQDDINGMIGDDYLDEYLMVHRAWAD